MDIARAFEKYPAADYAPTTEAWTDDCTRFSFETPTKSSPLVIQNGDSLTIDR
ncbi:MAG: hypothetical protein ABI137_09610 [Antricoccus sp.]